MENLTITLSGEGLQDTQELSIQISIAAVINITAKTAQRKTTNWLISEVGNMLMGGTPQLIIRKDAIWRVPVLLTSSRSGTVGQVSSIDIDADSGDLLINNTLREQILNNVQNLSGTPSPTTG